MTATRKPGMPFILISVLIDAVSIGIIIPVFPQLIMSMTGCTTAEAAVTNSWMMFWFALMQFFMSPVLGSLSDRFGRRPILLLSIFGFFVDFLLLGFAPSIGWLFAGRIFAGMMGASYTTAMAYTADVTQEENRSKYFGMLGATFGMGFILGPGIGALLAHFGDVRLPFYFCAALSLGNFLYGYFILPESLSIENRRTFEWIKTNPFSAFKNLTQYKSLGGLFLAYFLLYLAAQSVMTTWQYYTMARYQWQETDIAISLVVIGLLVALVQGLLVRWVQPKIGIYRTVMVGMVLYIIGFAGYGLAPTGFWLMMAAVPHCLGGINGPAMQSVMTSQVPLNRQGELQGTISSLQSTTAILGPPLMSGLFAEFSQPTWNLPGAPYLMGSLMILVALFMALKALKSIQKNQHA